MGAGKLQLPEMPPHPGEAAARHMSCQTWGERHAPLWPHQPSFLESLTDPSTTVKPLSDWRLMVSSPSSHGPMSPGPTHFSSLLTPTVALFQGQAALLSAALGHMRRNGFIITKFFLSNPFYVVVF